ncbi:MAG: AI-2E family transporter [Alphaproteobacteria bacterium]
MARSDKMDGLTKTFLVSALVLLSVILLIYGSGVLVPLAIGLLIWFLINAIAGGFQRLSVAGLTMPRALAFMLSMASIVVAGFMVVDLVVSNLSAMSARTLDFDKSLNPLIDKIADFAGISNKDILNQIFDKIGLEKLFKNIISAMAGFASQLGVILVYVIFLLIEQQFFDAKLNALVKDDAKRNRIQGILEKIASDVQSYILIMTMVSALTSGLSYLVMLWIGLDHAGFWAFLVFVLNFIPTIGSVLGTVFPALFALLQFQNFTDPLILLAAIGAIQFVIGNFLQPRLAGKTLNMSQFVVILSLFVWGAMWGVTGMFLAVPMTAILMIVLSNFELTRPAAILMSQEGRVDTIGGPN